MDTLTSSPALFVHAELFKRILKRSFRAVVGSNAAYDVIYQHQQPQKLQISRAKEAANSSQRSPFLELVCIPESARFDLCSVLAYKVAQSTSNPQFSSALEANNGRNLSDGGESLGIGQQRPPRRRFTEKEESLHSDRIVAGAERNTEDAKDADVEGSLGHEEHEISSEELGTRSRKEKASRNLARGGTSEVLSSSEDETAEDEKFMLEALKEARKAAKIGEVPVGAVVVQNGRIIARAYNRVEAEGDPTAHAEMLCIRSAAKATGDWRLMNATMYVTMEPCPMCAGAVLQARLKRVVWGARNHLLGADGSWISLFPDSNPAVKGGSQPQHPFHKTLQCYRPASNFPRPIRRSFLRCSSIPLKRLDFSRGFLLDVGKGLKDHLSVEQP